MRCESTIIVFFALVGAFSAASPAAPPQVTNLLAQQRADTKLVDIAYDLNDRDSSNLSVSVVVSTDNGATCLSATRFSGNGYGSDVAPGTGKQIVWDAAADWNGHYSTQVWFQVTADDSVASNACIPAGRFTMGDMFNEGWDGETPAHTVDVGLFYMDKHEVTLALWDSVYRLAIANGYAFDSAGGGKAATHPIHTVNWYDCVKWCNARSEMQGLTPCYYTSAARSAVYRSGKLDLDNDWVDWSANGNRLPTEAEWEKAARGGAAGRRFAWSDADTINQSRANYFSYWSGNHPYYAYDGNATEGYHPAYAVDGAPYTSPAGSFAANDYGLYDLIGNVWEWCWDRYDPNWYHTAGASQSDARGPSSGGSRVGRGGGWHDYARGVRAATRQYAAPGYQDYGLGFRCVRNQITISGATGSAIYGPIAVDTRAAGQPVPADFDGDRLADPATVDSAGNWYFWLSTRDYRIDGPFALGITGESPLAADFDGDGLADPAVANTNGNWQVWRSADNYRPNGSFAPGIADGSPLAADFDGDSKADPALANLSGNWRVWLSSGNYRPDGPLALGIMEGTPVAGDFDGDGRADPAIVDGGGTWFIWKSGSNYRRVDITLSGPSGTPAAGDFDGDGLADPAMVTSSGNWYVWRSAASYQLDGPFPFIVP